MNNPICEKHGIEMKIRYVYEGTPFQDFDGYYCPQCRHEQEVTCDHPVYVPKEYVLLKEAELLRRRATRLTPRLEEIHYWSWDRVDRIVGNQLQKDPILRMLV